MSYTNFSNGVSSMGIPLVGSLPMIRGKWFFVNPDTTYSETQNPYPGSASNSGLTVQKPMASLVTAYNTAVDGRGDGICLLGGGTTTAECTSYLTAALTWSKSAITVFGVCAPTMFSQRARISTAAANLANLLNITGDNNAFYNISLYNGGTTGAGCVKLDGADRNYFNNVHFMGGMGMTTATVNDYDLYLNDSDENTFVNCVIGSDTFDKTDIAGTEMFLDGGCMRNRFIGCEFISFRSAGTTAGMINLVGSDAITRTHIFDNCMFHMYRDGNVTAEATVVIGDVPNNGFLIFRNCDRHGFTDWCAVAATARVYSASKANAEASGITIAANPS